VTLLQACIVVLIVYVAINMGVGIWSVRRTRSASDFVMGSRTIGPWVTALSYIAVYFSSVLIIGGGAFGYKFGMATVWIGAINVVVGCTLCWIVLGKRVREMTEHYGVSTISGFFAKRFNSPAAGIYSAAVAFLFLIVYNVSVVKGMANAFQVLMNLPYWGGVLISGLVIIFYVVLGGYMAVVWTSFIQAWIMLFALIMLAVAALSAAGGIQVVNARLAAMDPGLVSTPGVWGWQGLISYCLIVSLGVWGMPQLLVRFYSMENTRVLRLGTVLATLGGAMAVLPYLAGAVARTLLPPLQNPDLAIPMLTKTVLNPWGGAIFLAGVLAAGMSTFASVLIIVSAAIVKDLRGSQGSAPRTAADGARDVLLGRLASMAAGVVSLVIAFRPPALILVVTAFSWAVIASACLWPVVLGVYWKRGTREGAIASMVAGTATSLGWMIAKMPFGIHGFIPGVLASLVVFVAVSLATKPTAPALVEKAWGLSQRP
jgi:SSS family transporter